MKIQNYASILGKWNREKRKSLHRDVGKKKKELATTSSELRSDSWKKVRRIESRLENLLEKEECYWK